MFKKFFKWVEDKAKGFKKDEAPKKKAPEKKRPEAKKPAPPAKKGPTPKPPKPEKPPKKAEKPKAPVKPVKQKKETPKAKPKPKPAPAKKPEPKSSPKEAEREKPSPPPPPPPEEKPKAAPQATPEPERKPEPKPEPEPVPEPEPAPEPAPEPPPEEEKKPVGWLSRLKQKLTKSSSRVSAGITKIFATRKLDAATLEELEELLISSDLGVETAVRVTEALAKKKVEKKITPDEVRRVLAGEIAAILKPAAKDLDVERGHKPHIILMVGVNGTGKTTTIGKMAQMLKALGKKVMVAAGDTFRAAAIEQLEIWAERADVPIVKGEIGGDAASVAFTAIDAANKDGIDVLIIDTAGRLQNRTELMDELAKIVRVIKKKDETAPHDTILVLDATTGQNALLQTQVFLEAVNVSGIIMTKLDGTAKGGILVACTEKFHLPVYGIGVGETLEDLQPFDAEAFANALVGFEPQEVQRP